jgi:hypothetical protein
LASPVDAFPNHGAIPGEARARGSDEQEKGDEGGGRGEASDGGHDDDVMMQHLLVWCLLWGLV